MMKLDTQTHETQTDSQDNSTLNCSIFSQEENLLNIKELTTKNLIDEANQLINKYSASNNEIKKSETNKKNKNTTTISTTKKLNVI